MIWAIGIAAYLLTGFGIAALIAQLEPRLPRTWRLWVSVSLIWVVALLWAVLSTACDSPRTDKAGE